MNRFLGIWQLIKRPCSGRQQLLWLSILFAFGLMAGSLWLATAGRAAAAPIDRADRQIDKDRSTPDPLPQETVATEGLPPRWLHRPVSLIPSPFPPVTPTTRPLGTVLAVTNPANCDTAGAGGMTGQFCYALTISCTQTAVTDIVVLQVNEPATNILGTIIFAGGFDGTYNWDDARAQRVRVLNELVAAGYRTVQMDWQTAWWQGSSTLREGFGNLACRPATAMQWVYDNLNGSNEAFCATGHSNGASQVALPMAQYGMADQFTAVLLESGPNWSRVDHACLSPANSLYFTNLTERRYVDVSLGVGTPTVPQSGACATNNVIRRPNFEEMSLSYNNWDFVYADTSLAFMFGAADMSTTRTHGENFYTRVVTTTPWLTTTTIAGAGHFAADTVTGADTLRDYFLNQCVPPAYHVANTLAECVGNTPCLTGMAGLPTAVNSLPVANGSVTIYGNYIVSPTGSTPINRSRPILLQGATVTTTIQSGSGACSGPFLTLDNGAAEVTIQDLTLDGDAGCSSGQRDGLAVNSGTAVISLTHVTLQDLGTAVAIAAPQANISFHNTGNSYSNNTVGISLNDGDATILDDTFANNTLAIQDNTSGVVVIGDGPTTGSSFTDNSAAIQSDGHITLKGNTISGGGTGILLTGDPTALYGNNISGVSGLAVDCDGTATLGAAFNYLGGVSPSSGSDCTDVANQLGAPIVNWTEGTTLNQVSSTAGPLFDLGLISPYGYLAPIGQLSNFYAAANGTVTVNVAGTQFKMLLDGTGCVPMTPTCWQSVGNGRAQTAPGYFYAGPADPTAIHLQNLTVTGGNMGLASILFGFLASAIVVVWHVKSRRLSRS